MKIKPSTPATSRSLSNALSKFSILDEDALIWAKKSASHPNSGFWAFLGLAATQAMLGQKEDAEDSLKKGLDMKPKISQDYLEQVYPGAIMRLKQGLKIAGLN